MWTWLKIIIGTLRSSVLSRRELALENLVLRQQLATLRYRAERYHESLNNLTPEDVYTGRGQTGLNRRQRIKRRNLAERTSAILQRQSSVT